MKGVSLIMSSVMLILIVILLTMFIAPWMMGIAKKGAKSTEDKVTSSIVCQNVAYDFDYDYGTYGVVSNFTGENDTLSVKIINTGRENIYGFSVELLMRSEEGYEIISEPDINVTPRSQSSKEDPLKPGRSTILETSIVDINDTWQLEKVRVLNEVCPSVYAEVEL